MLKQRHLRHGQTSRRYRPLRPRAVLWMAAVLLAGGCHMQSQGLNVEGVQMHQQGQYAAAIDRFNRALAKNPQDADAYYNLAATYHELGKVQHNPTLVQQSEELYHRCLDIDPNHPECRRGLAVLLVETNRTNDALTMLQRWDAASPHLAAPRLALAQLYDEFSDPSTARIHLNEAVAREPTNHVAWRALGKHYEDSGDFRRALANYNRSHQINNMQQDVAARIASLQRAVGGGAPAPTGDTRWVGAPHNAPR